MKAKKLLLGVIGIAGVSALALGGRKSRAATKPSSGKKPPSNLAFVDGKLDAVSAGARVAATDGPFIIVAADAEHRQAVLDVASARARAHPEFEYILADMDLARQLAADRGFELPEDAWGGVASVIAGDMVSFAYFRASDTDVDGMVAQAEGLERSVGDALPPFAAEPDYGVPITGDEQVALPPGDG